MSSNVDMFYTKSPCPPHIAWQYVQNIHTFNDNGLSACRGGIHFAEKKLALLMALDLR